MIYSENNQDDRFEKIYSNINNENIQKVEQIRKQIKTKKILKNITFMLILTASVIFNINSEKIEKTMPFDIFMNIYQVSMYSLYFGVPLWAASCTIKSKKTKAYEKQYKNAILSSFINLYDKNFTYRTKVETEENEELKNDYRESKFSIGTVGGIDLVKVENSISGKIEYDTTMNLYDISVEQLKEGYSNDGREATATNHLFKGTYIVLNMTPKMPTNIRISKNKFIPRKNKVELDSSEFEKYFDVNSEDANLAVRILTADVMQILVKFYKKYHLTFEIVLRGKKVHINLHTEGAFKVPVYNSVDKGQIYLYYAILEFATNLSKEINKVLNGIEL